MAVESPADFMMLQRARAENAALRERVGVLEGLTERAVVALDDWIHMYASEHCDEERVRQAGARIRQHGGTLAYVGTIISDARAALKTEEE